MKNKRGKVKRKWIMYWVVCIVVLLGISFFKSERATKDQTSDSALEDFGEFVPAELLVNLTNVMVFREGGIDFGRLFYFESTQADFATFLNGLEFEEIKEDHYAYKNERFVISYLLARSEWNFTQEDQLLSKLYLTGTKSYYKPSQYTFGLNYYLSSDEGQTRGLLAIK